MSIRLITALAVCCAALHGADAKPAFSERHPRYRLQPNDVIEVQYRYTPEYNSSMTVQPDGYVSLQLVGDVYVAGATLEQASKEIAKAAATRLREPEVTIVLKDFVKPRFVVAGEVNKPGSYELRGDVTAVQAIAMSGGFKDSAKHSQVMLVRRVDNEWAEVKALNMKQMMSSGQLSEDIQLRPDDIILVPQSILSRMDRFVRWTALGITGVALARP